MKNIKIKFITFFLAIILFGTGTTVHATLNITADVDVPASCSATDTDGVIHNYSGDNSYLAICALETALNNGSIERVQLSNKFPSLGLFVATINDVIADPNSQYWAIYQNGNYANVGIALLPVSVGDIIMFQLHDFSDNNLGDQIMLHIRSLSTASTPTGGGPLLEYTAPVPSANSSALIPQTTTPATITPTPTFSVPNAVTYLKSVQSGDGSFDGSDMYSDWVAIAYGAKNVTDTSRDLLLSYMNTHAMLSSNLTDNERHAMALLAFGQNPYSFHGVDYITTIVNSFDGTQFGDSSLINDDIFALISLSSAGYTANDEIITKDIAFILSRQKTDGSFDESADMTAAGIQALAQFFNITGVSTALAKASSYLQNSQSVDGGWGNVSATSWALQASSSLGASWTKNGKSALDYLATEQSIDGGVLSSSETLQNRIWATSYAIPAVLEKSWNTILHPVSKPVSSTSSIAPSSPTLPATIPIVKNSVATISKEKKSETFKPKPISSSVIVQNVPRVIPLIEEKKISMNALTATPKKSGVKIPLLFGIITIVLASGVIVLTRTIKHRKQ